MSGLTDGSKLTARTTDTWIKTQYILKHMLHYQLLQYLLTVMKVIFLLVSSGTGSGSKNVELSSSFTLFTFSSQIFRYISTYLSPLCFP